MLIDSSMVMSREDRFAVLSARAGEMDLLGGVLDVLREVLADLDDDLRVASWVVRLPVCSSSVSHSGILTLVCRGRIKETQERKDTRIQHLVLFFLCQSALRPLEPPVSRQDNQRGRRLGWDVSEPPVSLQLRAGNCDKLGSAIKHLPVTWSVLAHLA
jgi:hypothetical protein